MNESSYCTKDNCTNNTLIDHGYHQSRTSTLLAGEGEENEQVERACDTLFMCIVTTLNKGLRNGGGIGDVLRQPSSRVSKLVLVKLTFYPLCSNNIIVNFLSMMNNKLEIQPLPKTLCLSENIQS